MLSALVISGVVVTRLSLLDRNLFCARCTVPLLVPVISTNCLTVHSGHSRIASITRCCLVGICVSLLYAVVLSLCIGVVLVLSWLIVLLLVGLEWMRPLVLSVALSYIPINALYCSSASARILSWSLVSMYVLVISVVFGVVLL